MAFSVSGRIAQGAQDELQQMLAQALAEEQLATSARLQQQRIDQDARQFDESQALQREGLAFNRQRAEVEDQRDFETQQDRTIRDMRAFQREFDEKSAARQDRFDEAERREAERAQDREWRVADRDFAAKQARELAGMRPGREPDKQWVVDAAGQQHYREPIAGDRKLESGGSGGSDKSGGQMSEVLPFMQGMKGISDTIHSRADGASARIGGLVDRAQAATGYDDDTRDYQQQLETFTPMLARLVGHVGVLTQLDVESARQMLPPPGATKSEAQRAWGNVDRFLRGKGVNLGLSANPDSLRTNPNAPAMNVQMPPGAVVRMRAPNGQEKDVPASEVQLYLSKGATVVRGR